MNPALPWKCMRVQRFDAPPSRGKKIVPPSSSHGFRVTAFIRVTHTSGMLSLKLTHDSMCIGTSQSQSPMLGIASTWDQPITEPHAWDSKHKGPANHRAARLGQQVPQSPASLQNPSCHQSSYQHSTLDVCRKFPNGGGWT